MNSCTCCKKLIADSETYGGIDCPMCWERHSSAMFDGDPPQMIDAAIFAADAEPQPVRVFVTDRQQQEAANKLAAQQAEIERLTKELNARARQIGIACHKHDLTHSLECGACAREARAERDAYKKAIIIHNDCCRRACDERGEYCSPYKDRGMQCPDCHHHDMIEVTAAMAGERT